MHVGSPGLGAWGHSLGGPRPLRAKAAFREEAASPVTRVDSASGNQCKAGCQVVPDMHGAKAVARRHGQEA